MLQSKVTQVFLKSTEIFEWCVAANPFINIAKS